MEETTELRILPRKSVAAIAGAPILASSASSPAFTLSAPSLERPVAAADVESVDWHGGWHRWGWGPRWGYRYGYGPVWRCWWSPWGFRRCGRV